MPSQTVNPARVPEGFVQGKEIELETWRDGNVALGLSGKPICYLGYRKKDQPPGISFYAVSVGSHYPDGRDSYSFVRLSSGTLHYDCFFSRDSYYRVLDNRFVILPSGANNYYGVIDSTTRKEDKELTRQLFGGTIDEVESVATAFGKLCGRYFGQYLRLPRVTFSRTRDNECDITGCLIPCNFPYIAFEQSQYQWSHVSLFGFYRLLSLLNPSHGDSPIHAALMKVGTDQEVLQRLGDRANEYGRPIRLTEFVD